MTQWDAWKVVIRGRRIEFPCWDGLREVNTDCGLF